LTASKTRQLKGFMPLVPGVTHVPYPYCYRCPFHLKFPECDYYCVDFIGEQVLDKYVPPEEVSAMFFESIQGEGGYVVPPDDYFRRLEKLLKPHGILMVDDEVQSGMGRTGKWFAIQHFGVEPDIMLISKAIAAGLPLSAMVAKKEIMTWGPGSHASTFGANPVATAAALATISMIENEKLMANATKVGGHIKKRLEEMKEKYEIIGDVRGKGLMVGAEIVNDRRTKEYGTEHVNNILDYTWKHGVLLISCGRSTLRLIPPLIIDEDLADEALEVVKDAIARENSS
jgi:4-aminobutyrate aminotransferase